MASASTDYTYLAEKEIERLSEKPKTTVKSTIIIFYQFSLGEIREEKEDEWVWYISVLKNAPW